MKPASLSMRLGLTVSTLGALLVVFLAILAYFALTHELNALSRDSLQKKMAQVEHSLSMYVDATKSAASRIFCSIRSWATTT